MLGAVIAFRRDEHMRMTAAVAGLPPQTRATFDLFATCAALAFLLLIAWPAYQYAEEETFITTPALSLNNAWRAAALPSGIALMALFALLSHCPRRIAAFDLDFGRYRRRYRRGILACRADVPPARQSQPADFLRRRRGRGRLCRRADRLRLRSCHLRLPGADDAYAADGPDRAHGRGHEPSHPAGGAAVRLSRPAHRDDRHGARHGRLSGKSARPCPRRPALCAGRGDVSGIRHLGREGRRHGGGRAGAVSRNEGARRQTRRSRRAVVRDRRANRDHSAEPGPHHHRLGDRRVDRGAVHRRAIARRGARDSALLCRAPALSRGKISAT